MCGTGQLCPYTGTNSPFPETFWGAKLLSRLKAYSMIFNEKTGGQLREKGLPGIYDLKKIWHPSWFQGNRRKKNYFEGWYFKLVSHDLSQAWAFIPGISLNNADEHSFIQVIDGNTGKTWHYRFPVNAFNFSKETFNVRIGANHFSSKGMYLSLNDHTGTFEGKVMFTNTTPFRASLLKPGIMGWYRYIPFMECYHGVVSMDHLISGTLDIQGQTIDFSDGRGYMEKDWGVSMPKAWIWMQTNHFSETGTSFMLSLADVPLIGKTFPGFLGFIHFNGSHRLFATYTGSKITSLKGSDRQVWLSVEDKDMTLEIRGEKTRQAIKQIEQGALKAPVSGQMSRIIHESMLATIHVRLTSKQGNILFEDTGQRAGLEMVGDISLLNKR